MNVLITGSHGLVGSELISSLQGKGNHVGRLVRSKQSTNPDEVKWSPEQGQLDQKSLEGFDGVVHLAGDSIASGRWTSEKKAKIRDSRIKGTKLLCESLASLASPPKVLVSASAIGFYGDRGDELLTEESARGKGFLADVCAEWEAATQAARDKGIRVVMLRFGVILSPKGGALKQMLPPFQMGAGGRLGSGKQYMSWVSLEDIIAIIEYALTHEELSGPVNAVAPGVVTNNEFTKALGEALHRPAIFPVPGFGIRILLGEMADELLLSSQRVQPGKLLKSGYVFQKPTIQPALQSIFAA